MSKPEFIIFDRRETLRESVSRDVISTAFLLLCIYVSRDSAWWTFVTGTLFIMFLAGKFAVISGQRSTKIYNAEDAMRWARSIKNKEDETP